ncbi:MAG: hypothetical protein ACREUD_01235 [Gammaproteobacteria bacterium]
MNLSLRTRLFSFVLIVPLVLLGACAGQPAKTSAPDAPVLGFGDFYKLPVGPRGLEPTHKLLTLRDKRVRVQGYMVKEEEPLPGLFMLTPLPVAMAELADGPSDYLPPATLFVHLAGGYEDKIVAYRPGTWAMSGTLSLGARQEPNGRVSYVRLMLEDPESVRTADDQTPEFFEEGAPVRQHHH